MNKRIRELAEQADAVHIQGKLKDRALVGYDSIEKFAQLIIDECMTLCNCEDAQDIMEHFRDKDKI